MSIIKRLRRFLKLYTIKLYYDTFIKLYYDTLGFRGLLCAIKAKATKSQQLLRIERQDLKYPLWLRIPSSDTLTYKQIFIDYDYNFSVHTQPKTIVDAGANIGLSSIYFASKYPRTKIIAIEPEEKNFELLKKNVAPYSNIIPVQAALWGETGELSVVDPGFGEWGYMTYKDVESLTNEPQFCISQKIPALTVSDIIDQFSIEQIDILKIDIEGAEKEVFENSSRWITKVNSIIIELHERLKVGCNRSFYCGSNGFDQEWKQGENIFLSRTNCILPPKR